MAGGTGGYKIGTVRRGQAGVSVSATGDVNGDGLLTSSTAPDATSGLAGSAYVDFGEQSPVALPPPYPR